MISLAPQIWVSIIFLAEIGALQLWVLGKDLFDHHLSEVYDFEIKPGFCTGLLHYFSVWDIFLFNISWLQCRINPQAVAYGPALQGGSYFATEIRGALKTFENWKEIGREDFFCHWWVAATTACCVIHYNNLKREGGVRLGPHKVQSRLCLAYHVLAIGNILRTKFSIFSVGWRPYLNL